MTSNTTPYRQIRAKYTPTTITVYQAYNTEIAKAAVEHQKLNASPKFSTSRMTWIKPSWAWMLYRAGYSYKDKGQERILALTLTHTAFLSLLQKAVLSHGMNAGDVKRDGEEQSASVRVQWDPERTIRLEKLGHRSIQIGVPGAFIDELVEGIVEIDDVTDKARDLKRVVDESDTVEMAELVERGLVPREQPFDVDDDLREILEMD